MRIRMYSVKPIYTSWKNAIGRLTDYTISFRKTEESFVEHYRMSVGTVLYIMNAIRLAVEKWSNIIEVKSPGE